MSSEAKLMPVPPLALPTPEKRRGRKPGDGKDKSGSMVVFYLGDDTHRNNGQIVLKEECASEGAAMVESLKKSVPYYRIEVWQARAVVKDGSVEVKKDQISVRA